MLKSFAQSIGPVFESLSGARSELLVEIRNNCRTEVVNSTIQLINEVINEDVTYQKTPLDLRNQRTYAVKAGVSGFLDVARQTFKEATEDVHQHVTEVHRMLAFFNVLHFTHNWWQRDMKFEAKLDSIISENTIFDFPKTNLRVEAYRIYLSTDFAEKVMSNARL
ncbi:hypothetical protein OCU04_000687 [Sclerotinia nivalis]|uniref:Uncharacterized protein n=1 Tax=Sclerotinia nivalis TaxID=352851 RepID=A0A9X0DQI5_9HELO|nr:hypothetical protein OCU04_000687 [Sclerotinia nivalis]